MAALWSILTDPGPILAAVLLGPVVWYKWMTRTRRRSDGGYEYVLVLKDGSAREVTANEREYLETDFSPADGARPYIKFRYESVDGWESIEGFLLRRQLPGGVAPRRIKPNLRRAAEPDTPPNSHGLSRLP